MTLTHEELLALVIDWSEATTEFNAALKAYTDSISRLKLTEKALVAALESNPDD